MTQGKARTALVTGASAGIGEAFARLLAEDGFDLVLTARRLQRLQALGQKLQEAHGVRVTAIGEDLSDPDAPRRIAAQLEENGTRVDMLVNNAGYGIPEPFLGVGWEAHAAFIQVMVTAVCDLTYKFLPGMIERGYGRIINVSSVAGLLTGSAGSTLYGAAKSFLIKFSESLWLELEGTGVHVTALCPGFTYTELHDVSGTREQISKTPAFMWMQARTVARQGIDAVMRGDPVYVNGVFNGLLAGVTALSPRGLALSISRSLSKRLAQK
jgi:short-subunit dehydrogenase